MSSWPLPVFRLEEYLGLWEFRARYHLTASDMESWTLSEILELVSPEERQAWQEQSLSYIPSDGLPELRARIASTYTELEPDQVLVFSGAEEGLYCAMYALLGKDDHAIVTVPNYQAMEELPRALCASVSGLPLRPENGWDLDLDELRALWRPNTRMLAVNFPNNPTGKVISPERWTELLDFVQDRDAWLFSDEVYRGLERNPADCLDQASDRYPRALSLNVMSKAYGLPGLRIGWIGCQDRDLLRRLERIKHYLTICNSAPSERLAALALSRRDHLLARNRAIVAENLVALRAFLARQEERFRWHEPEGGCVGFVERRAGDTADWCRELVEAHGILLLPSHIYTSPLAPVPANYFRIGFGRRNFGAGLSELERRLG